MIPPLHLVTDDTAIADPGFSAKARDAIEAGAGRVAFHLRGPRSSGRRVFEVGTVLRPIARSVGATFLVNDRVDVALVLGADGVHLGERSLDVRVARRLMGSDALVGRSVHDSERVASSEVDYLVAGPIHATESHPDTRPSGVGLVSRVRHAHPAVPVVAIGGITRERVAGAVRSGASGVAVVRAWWKAADAGTAVTGLLDALDEAFEAAGVLEASRR